MSYLFGYGSLLSPVSAARTLQRPLTMAELLPTRLHGYRRTWTAAVDVIVTENGISRDYSALFLDLTPTPGMSCNGVLLEVNESEWALLDLRERNYQRTAVQVESKGNMVPAFTYIIPDDEKQREGVVLKSYLDLVHRALLDYPEEFRREFWGGTDEPEALIAGDYVFQDNEQNRAAGRE
jgi:cation transport regulator ChaC